MLSPSLLLVSVFLVLPHTVNVHSVARSGLNIEEVLQSALRMSFKKKIDNKVRTLIGNAVAISPKYALTALHGKADKGHDIVLHTSNGVKLNAKVAFNAFEAERVDIAVLELQVGQFPHW